MFELLSSVESVPIRQDALTMVQRGMNKVRVSVGEHNSEPSEVYIVTGRSEANLETYIIFYMLEPGIHVVYGFDQNPYDPELLEQVIEEATAFVEEMGSILEEVPLDTMTPAQRTIWFEKENLYSEPISEDLEELEELEEIEDLEVVPVDSDDDEELELGESPADRSEDSVVEVSDEEVQQLLSEDDPGESSVDRTADERFISGEGSKEKAADQVGVDTARREDVVVAEGDFDELLKQAFLKPDIVEKTRKKSIVPDELLDDEQPFSVDQYEDEDEDLLAEEVDLAEAIKEVAAGVDIQVDLEPDPAAGAKDDPSRQGKPAEIAETTTGKDDRAGTPGNTALTVIRFLSKF